MSKASPSRAVSSGSSTSIANLRPFLVLGAWGVGAALALMAAVVAARTDLGGQRLQAAIAAILSPPAGPDQRVSEQISALSGALEKQMRRQADMMRSLAEQHDAVAQRVGVLERQLNELDAKLVRTATHLEGETRSAQQAAATASAGVAANRALQAKTDPAEASTLPAPAPSLVARTPASQAAPPPTGQSHAAASSPSSLAVTTAGAPTLSHTGTAASAASEPDGIVAGTIPPFPTPQHQAAPPDPWPVAQARRDVAKASPSLLAAPPVFRSNPLMVTGIFATPAELGPTGGEFAIDLGAGPTIEALRARWNELRVSQSPLLDNLKPLISLKDAVKSGQELHLIAGPLVNQPAAHRLCAVLVGTSTLCQPTLYEGQRLVAQ